MANLKQNVNKEKDLDSESDSPDITQQSLRSQTHSYRNNTFSLPVQLSSDSLEKPLNGAQPTLFVRSSVPAVSAPADALPTGALVNGPGSHPTSDELGVLNKSSVSLSNALHVERVGKVYRPQMSQLTNESRPDTRKNEAECVLKTLSMPAGADVLWSKADGSELEAHGTSLSREDQDKMPNGQTRMTWGFDAESLDNSSDDYDLNWDHQKKFMQFLWNDHSKEDSVVMENEAMSLSVGRRRRKRKMDTMETADLSEDVCSNLSHTSKRSLMDGGSDYESPISNRKVHFFRKKPSLQSSVDSCEKYSSDTVVAIKQLILSAPVKKHRNGNSVGEADSLSLVSGKLKQLKMELSTGSEQRLSFFPCAKSNINFKEKKHFHKHMMYHLKGHNQVHHLNLPQPFICRECGCSFCDRNTLLKHMIIHQERREELMEEIKGPNELQDKGRNARLQCPQCVFATSCPKIFVKHAKTHKRDKRYYCCGECNLMTVTEHELEAHLYAAHCVTCKPHYMMLMKSDRSKEQVKFAPKKNDVSITISFPCKICPFSTQSKNVLKKHVELMHQLLYQDDFESPSYNDTNDCAAPIYEQRFLSKSQKADSQRHQLKPKFIIEKQAFRKKVELPFWSNGIADLFIKSKSSQKARKGFNSSLFKWSLSNSTNKLSPSLRRSDKPSKLSLQLAEKIDVTGLPYDDDSKDDRGYRKNAEKPKSLLSCYEPLASKTEPSCMYFPGCDSDILNGQGDSEDSDSRHLTTQSGIKKSTSKRKMSTPCHNIMDKAVHFIIPKHEKTSKRHEVSENSHEDTYDFSDYTSEATTNFLGCSENEQNLYARSYFICRQRLPVKGDSGPSSVPSEKHCEEEKGSDETQKLVVKEECVKSELSGEPLELGMAPRSDSSNSSPFGMEQKSCPYCPAVFESGVGLSNHVRGHLHRVGLSYDARHVVSPEQVASQDRQPRICRKITLVSRRIKKANKPESQAEHTCPLCGGWFDTKTGLSNHVRGHLKQIGKTISSKSKSPLCILNEMMQDQEEYQNILQVMNKKRFLSRPFVPQKFASSDGLFLTPTGIPVKIQHANRGGRPWGLSMLQQEEEGREKRQTKTEHGVRGCSSSTLIELLKRKKLDEDLGLNNCSQVARKHLDTSCPKDTDARPQLMRTEPSWTQEKSEINKKVCAHCNTTFPSAVSLSNHVRARARRKRVALLEGTSYDCKQKKQKLRPGPKKKVFPLPHGADEIYRLTCRFCDLVFQGPLSVQEDWIKHLQRHIMNTGVPCTGAGMVEVTSLSKDLPSTPEEQTALLVLQAAS
ncbi:zinc finger protein 644-like [Megalops cyprinoides]|uniref:zinc finger protein 644-like n=1 Tax=Megalops cyprinoides TaxID=118141 RepID=UPI001864728F|nr:zinc finger protein 644-like [Megalops cyprinoides]